ncbi:MAG: tetratricopeptide repeat protein, partial [Patescibacteria group bacterium]|nr:tetratricopeptide repeat protein [Patescibacteria group bacterium]
MTEQDLRNAIRRAPRDPHAHLSLADHFLATGRAPAAEQHYRRAEAFQAPARTAFLGVARACLAQSKLDEARRAAELVLRNYPG